MAVETRCAYPYLGGSNKPITDRRLAQFILLARTCWCSVLCVRHGYPQGEVGEDARGDSQKTSVTST